MLLRHLRYWSFHVGLNAAPSFVIAGGLFEAPPLQITAMVCGILCFIGFYTAVTSSAWFRRRIADRPAGRAFRLATRIRSIMAVVALIGCANGLLGFGPLGNLFAVELWAGFVASRLVENVGKTETVRAVRNHFLGGNPVERAQSVWLGDMNSFVPVLLTTLTEGVLLSLLMLGIAVVIYGFLCLRGTLRRCPPP